MRLLCDLDEQGAALLADYLGLPNGSNDVSPFAEPWNTTVGGKPAVGSIMLTRDAFPDLLRFAMFRAGYQYVLQEEGAVSVVAFSDADVKEDNYLHFYVEGTSSLLKQNGGLAFLYRNLSGAGGQPTHGTRNVHAFTGRSN
jgi:hypothetical protein